MATCWPKPIREESVLESSMERPSALRKFLSLFLCASSLHRDDIGEDEGNHEVQQQIWNQMMQSNGLKHFPQAAERSFENAQWEGIDPCIIEEFKKAIERERLRQEELDQELADEKEQGESMTALSTVHMRRSRHHRESRRSKSSRSSSRHSSQSTWSDDPAITKYGDSAFARVMREKYGD